MPDLTAAEMVEVLLAARHDQPPPEPDPEAEFATAVGLLIHDGLDRHTAEQLMRSAQGRGQDLMSWAEQMLRSRAEYRRKVDGYYQRGLVGRVKS